MKSLKLFLLMCLSATVSFANIAQPGLWQTLILGNGMSIRAELCGDEFCHFWRSNEGDIYMKKSGQYVKSTLEEVAEIAFSRRSVAFEQGSAKARSMSRADAPAYASDALKGNKKGLIILVDFSNKAFTTDYQDYSDEYKNYVRGYYSDMANKENYSVGNQKGSVYDYFKDQSNGQFLLNFDVVGPYTLSSYETYGKDGDNGETDVNVGKMIISAINNAKKDVKNWGDYDWNGDNEVEQVYIIYAGRGQASGGGADTVWPHKFNVMYHNNYQKMTVDDAGHLVDVYACSNEMRTETLKAGIGTICHEFSHCLGFPDMYDTTGNSGATDTFYGMGTWDLMCSGSHNNSGFCPPNYTAWEKMIAGWQQPTEFTPATNLKVENLKPISQNGETFIVYNQGNNDEYYMLENRKQEGWDRALAGSGLMILHVDYDVLIFDVYNAPNTRNGGNDHQRMTIFHADNLEGEERGDLYPYSTNNSFSNYSTPAATLYNKNSDGTKFMNIQISEITKNDDGTVSFVIGSGMLEGALFAETFDKCAGTGANDDKWMTMKTATATFVGDNDGWEASYIRGGASCARVGNTEENPYAVSPEISITGGATLKFKAAPFNSSKVNPIVISSTNADVTVSGESSFDLTAEKWTQCEVEFEGTGATKIKFSCASPFYLDQINVVSNGTASIKDIVIAEPAQDNQLYDLQGRRVTGAVAPGIYIQNGKKVLK